jgi:PAS domain S-box-containing protein
MKQDVVTPEAALAASEARYRAIAESAGELIIEFDETGTAVYYSPNHARIIGLSLEQMIQRGHGWSHPDDHEELARARRDLTEGREFSTFRFRILLADGSYRWFEATLRRFRTASGSTHGLVLARDVHERVLREEERRRHAELLESEVAQRTADLVKANHDLREVHARLLDAERLAAGRSLALSLAHAINNPLAALLGTLQLRRESHQTDDPLIDRCLRLAQRIRAVVEQAPRLLREGTLALAPADPAALVEELGSDLAERCGDQAIGLDLLVERGLAPALLDRALVGTALACVATNAIEAMPNGGVLSIEVESLPGAGALAFRIADTGPGIPADLRQRIFEPYFTTKPGASGLGLAIARGIVHGHEGWIRVEPRSGGGTLVTLGIPHRVADDGG